MEILEEKLYFIKDEFIEKYNPYYNLMENKSVGTKRPTYFCFRDKMNTEILWFVPMSTKYEKYLKINEDIKQKINREPNNFVFARNVGGKKAVFLIQNMFPTLEKYIDREYTRQGMTIKIPKSVKKKIGKKARNIFMLTNKGVKATFTNLPEFIKDIENELETKIER